MKWFILSNLKKIKHLLSARHYANCFTYIFLFEFLTVLQERAAVYLSQEGHSHGLWSRAGQVCIPALLLTNFRTLDVYLNSFSSSLSVKWGIQYYSYDECED